MDATGYKINWKPSPASRARARQKLIEEEYTMMGARYPTKKALKASVGQPLRYEETSIFGPEYKANGTFCVVGPSPYQRKWYAEVTMENGLIRRVK